MTNENKAITILKNEINLLKYDSNLFKEEGSIIISNDNGLFNKPKISFVLSSNLINQVLIRYDLYIMEKYLLDFIERHKNKPTYSKADYATKIKNVINKINLYYKKNNDGGKFDSLTYKFNSIFQEKIEFSRISKNTVQIKDIKKLNQEEISFLYELQQTCNTMFEDYKKN